MPNGFASPVGGELVFFGAFNGPRYENPGTYNGLFSEGYNSILVESESVSIENKTEFAEFVLNINPGKYKISVFGITTDGRYTADARLLDSSGGTILESSVSVNGLKLIPLTEIYLSGKYKPQVFRRINTYSSAGMIVIYKE